MLRYKASLGHAIHFRPGWDCHGLPIELKALHDQPSALSHSPMDVRTRCRATALTAVDRQRAKMREWGLLADYAHPYLTMDPSYEANQLRVLARMTERGLIFAANRPVFYSPSSRTALAEAELEYLDQHVSLSALVKFKLRPSNVLRARLPKHIAADRLHLVVWTTTPWTLPANKVPCRETAAIMQL